MRCKDGNEIQRGSMVLVFFPFPSPDDPQRIETKARPALVVQSDELTEDKDEVIVAQITTNTTRTGSNRVKVEQNSRCGQNMRLHFDSVIVTDNLAAVKERELKKVLGRCTDMPRVNEAMKFTFGLS